MEGTQFNFNSHCFKWSLYCLMECALFDWNVHGFEWNVHCLNEWSPHCITETLYVIVFLCEQAQKVRAASLGDTLIPHESNWQSARPGCWQQTRADFSCTDNQIWTSQECPLRSLDCLRYLIEYLKLLNDRRPTCTGMCRVQGTSCSNQYFVSDTTTNKI